MSKYDFPTQFECQNMILNVFPTQFECQNLDYKNSIFRLSSNVRIGFLMSKYDFPTQFECLKMILNVPFSDAARMSK